MLKVERFVLGPLMSNAYVVHNDKFAIVIDPGAEAETLQKFLNINNLSLAAIFVTHGHFDHVGGVKDLHVSTGATVYMHSSDVVIYKEAPLRAIEYNIKVAEQPLKPLKFLIGNEDLDINGNIVRVFHTPGHTQGGLSFYLPSINTIFTGDLLFKGTVGRTDFEGSSFLQLSRSIKSQVYTLDSNCIIYPGHGPSTTVGEEKDNNEFVRFNTI